MKIVVLGFEGSLPSGVLGLLDMFWLAGQALRRPTSQGRLLDWPVTEVITASVDGLPLQDGRGNHLAVDACVLDIEHCDVVLIPGLVPGEDGLPPRTPAMLKAAAWLREQHAHGAWVGASCAGVFVLGEAGLLNHRRCTTTWWLHEALTQRYPKAGAVWGSALLEDQRVISSGGPLSWVDLALHVIRTIAGPEAARLAADFAVIDNAPATQTVYTAQRHTGQRDPLLQEAEQAVRTAPHGFSTHDLAARLGLSERTLHRRLKTLVNESPKTFMTRIRLETACTLLGAKGVSVKRVAEQCGYRDDASFRRAFAQFVGMKPGEYRQWVLKRDGRCSSDAVQTSATNG